MVATETVREWDGRFSFAARTRDAGGAITAILDLAGATDMIAFSGGFPAPETWPTDRLADLAADLVRTDAGVALQYAATPGLPGLRAVLADRLAATQGRRPADGELLVTSGGIDALALIGRALLDAGDLVTVEAPSYLGAITAFRGYEADIDEIDMLDPGGLDVDAFAATLRAGRRPKLIYVIPDHQNPTGLTMGGPARARLVEVCRRYGVVILEDVAYRELGAPDDRDPLPSLWSLAPDVTVQMGTFSKTLFPGIRLGWAVGPEPVIAEMVTAKQNADQCAGALGQRIAEEHLRSGAYDAQLPRSRRLYAERRAAMFDACATHLPEGFSWTEPTGGFFTWLSGPPGLDTVALAGPAAAAKVAYVPGAPFYAGGGRGTHQLRLAYSRTTVADIHEGMARLGPLLAGRG